MAVRVVLTRTQEGSDRLSSRLLAHNIEVVVCPLIRIEPLEGPPIDPAGYDWIVLTSARAVECLAARLSPGAQLPKVAVIGTGTAAALRELGVEPALVARTSTQEGLVKELRPVLAGLRRRARVLFAGAQGARDVLVRELGADFVPLYRTVEVRPESFPAGDLVVLASASAARALAGIDRDLPCVSIGPVTSEAARRLGLRIVGEAKTHDLDGLVEAVTLAASHLSSRS